MVITVGARPVTEELLALGQGVWMDAIRRDMLVSGEFERMVKDRWITGVTSNPTIFEHALSGTHDYDAALSQLAQAGPITPYDAFVALASEDIGMAADFLRPVYEGSSGQDGFASLEVPPGLENDTAGTVAEAKRLFALLGRPNVLIKVPGTEAGFLAVEELIADGVNVNITLLFSREGYEKAALAYVRGLERRLDRGERVDAVASVASLFVSRLDSAVDRRLSEGSPLRGKVAIANARLVYERFGQIFSGERWDRLAGAGAKLQRPLWASTSTKNPDYPDTMYVEGLVAPHTINTMPESTLRAVLDHGHIRPSIEPHLAEARETLAAAADAGVDFKNMMDELLEEGLRKFADSFKELLDHVEAALDRGSRVIAPAGPLAALKGDVARQMESLKRDEIVRRIWDLDHTVWKTDPTEISNRLGWLDVSEMMAESSAYLREFADGVRADGIETVVLLGMGGSSLGPEVLGETFGGQVEGLALEVLDSIDPAQIRALEARIDPRRTLFLVSSKSGTTVETRSLFEHFWEQVPGGKNFTAITDQGTPLERLAHERGFRRTFTNPDTIGGRYSVLSYFGLVPAALAGIDLDRLLVSADRARYACHHCRPIEQNPGAWLGAVMGQGARAGRDKLTIVPPRAARTFGYWVEQLIAESTGKEGTGIIPVESEPLGPPSVYGADRLFVAFAPDPAVDALEAAGHPVVHLPFADVYELGSQFFLWEFATAVAGHVLGINPFDQPNVQEAKDRTSRILGGEAVTAKTPPLGDVLDSVRDGDYIAITAFMPRNRENESRLQAIRVALRERYRVATTVGFGPRYLHSTGQLHKGGPNTGVFIQLLSDEAEDIPVPGQDYTFGQLKRSQADGDLASLQAHRRRVTRAAVAEFEEMAR